VIPRGLSGWPIGRGDDACSGFSLKLSGDWISCAWAPTRTTLRSSRPTTWVVCSSTPARIAEGRAAAEGFLRGVRSRTITIHGFHDGYFNSQLAEIKDVFEDLGSVTPPDLVISPRLDDAHQDHRFVAELAWNTLRDHLILEYEIPTCDGDLSTPSVYVSLEPGILDGTTICSSPLSPRRRIADGSTRRLPRGVIRIRGTEAGGGTRYAEGFHARKARLAFGAGQAATGVGAPGEP